MHKKGRAMGGILTGIKKNVEEIEIQETVSEQLQERKIKLNNEIWSIITMYNNGKMTEMKNQLADFEGITNINILTGGDFNARIGEKGGTVNRIDGSEQARKSKDKLVNKEGEILINMTEEMGWTILNGNMEKDQEGEYTYIGARGESVIDYIIANEEAINKIKEFEVETRLESDHQPVTVQVKANLMKKIEGRTETKTITIWNDETIRQYTKEIGELEMNKTDDTGAELEELIVAILKATTTKTIKKRCAGLGTNTWWNKECREKKRTAEKALRAWRQGKGTKEEYTKHRREYKTLCKQTKHSMIEEERDKIRNIQTENDIWKYISADRKNRETANENIKMAEWEKHFEQQLNGEDRRVKYNLQIKQNDSNEEDITESEIRRQIAKLRKGKAAGEDELQNEVWIHANKSVIGKLTHIINRVWQGKGFPQRWRKGLISPIYKKGNREEAKNYRGITLLNTSYKIYAMILEEKLTKEIERRGLLPDTQAGFRKGRSTIDNIYILNYAIGREIQKEKGKLFILFADLKSAFDLLNRKKLIDMMHEKRINGRLTNRIAEIYEETINSVKATGNISKPFWTTKGVRQGCPLSPTLFALYLSDIEEYMARGQTGGLVIGKKKFWTLAYADDLACVAKTEEEMKSVMKRLDKYLRQKEMTLNPEKTKIMRCRKGGGREKKEKWEWQQEEIEVVKEFKYLGYTFQGNNGEEAHIKNITKKATIAMAQIWGIGQRKYAQNFRMRMLLFDYTVKSILMYAAEIWGWKEQEKIESVQTKYIRWILGLDVHTPKYIILEETKRNKMRIEAGKRAMKYEEKIRTNSQKEIANDCWKEISKREEIKIERNKWEIHRMHFYEKNGYAARDIERRRRQGQNMTAIITNRDADIQRQEQRIKIDNARYNTRYTDLITLGLPRYLQKPKNGEAIKTIARFRCGNEENSNKYWTEEEDRKCRICKKKPETLEHLLTECKDRNEEQHKLEDILDDTDKGLDWMKNVILRRNNLK